jgi:hypothetical protein
MPRKRSRVGITHGIVQGNDNVLQVCLGCLTKIKRLGDRCRHQTAWVDGIDHHLPAMQHLQSQRCTTNYFLNEAIDKDISLLDWHAMPHLTEVHVDTGLKE